VDVSRTREQGVAARMTVEEAARSLGIKEESVRKRVRRGKMRFEKGEDGRLYVYVDASQTVQGERLDRPEDMYDDRSIEGTRDQTRELIKSKVQTIRILQDKLQEEREARRRADTIIAQLTQVNAALAQRLPKLQAPKCARRPPREMWGRGRGTRAARYRRLSRRCAAPRYRRVPGAWLANPPVVEESIRWLKCRSTIAGRP
jgi:excisionase family DNA binding protein